MDSPESNSTDDDFIEKLSIPFLFFQRSFAQSIKHILQKGDQEVLLKIDWSESVPHPDKRVEYELWTNAKAPAATRRVSDYPRKEDLLTLVVWKQTEDKE